MSISTNIDGSTNGGGQLLDFISLVTNPKVYEAKIKSLQEATAENQKFVELIGPASEILDLRDKAAAAKAAAVSAAADAKVKASETIQAAQDSANTIITDANNKASQINSEAQAAAEDAKLAQAEARKVANEVKKAKADYDTLTEALKLQLVQVDKAQADALAAKQEAEAIRADLIIKHTDFIKSL
ncbi:hypothetical protein UFOVP118_80 [uncultured Caudovirales phage]|uniref:Uncharacterized protein n=1 Tax=uncultured Caudovirales phage TaxID=2100421 RepID=A0A6J5LCS0_9CAUD|nr:hypothetical protein UFOVP118_80 [uncultured Caudovirales phage]